MVELETMIAIGTVVAFFGFFSMLLKGARWGSIGMILVGVGITVGSGAALILGT